MSFWLHLFFNRSYNIQIISAYLLGARLGWCLVYNYNRKAEIKARNWEPVHRRPIYIEYIFHIFLKTFVSFPPIWHPIFCLPPSKSRRGKGAPAEEEPSHHRPQLHPAMFLRRAHPTRGPISMGLSFPQAPGRCGEPCRHLDCSHCIRHIPWDTRAVTMFYFI